MEADAGARLAGAEHAALEPEPFSGPGKPPGPLGSAKSVHYEGRDRVVVAAEVRLVR
jgi:hypothetical protein